MQLFNVCGSYGLFTVDFELNTTNKIAHKFIYEVACTGNHIIWSHCELSASSKKCRVLLHIDLLQAYLVPGLLLTSELTGISVEIHTEGNSKQHSLVRSEVNTIVTGQQKEADKALFYNL